MRNPWMLTLWINDQKTKLVYSSKKAAASMAQFLLDVGVADWAELRNRKKDNDLVSYSIVDDQVVPRRLRSPCLACSEQPDDKLPFAALSDLAVRSDGIPARKAKQIRCALFESIANELRNFRAVDLPMGFLRPWMRISERVSKVEVIEGLRLSRLRRKRVFKVVLLPLKEKGECMPTPTMCAYVAEKAQISEAEVRIAIQKIFDTMTEQIKRGSEVRIQGFGVFIPAKRKERKIRDSRTDSQWEVPPRSTVHFRPSKSLLKGVNVCETLG